MKKTNIILAALVASLAVVACNSGSSSSSGPAGPNVSTLTPPSGFTSGTTVGTSPVLWNAGAGSIAVPTASGYQVYTLPSDVAAAINAEGASNVVVSGANGGNLIVSLPTVTYSVTTVSGVTTAESYDITLADVHSNILSIESFPSLGIPAGLVYGAQSEAGQLLITTANSSGGVGSTTAVSLAGSGVSAGDEVTQLTPSTYQGSSFLGLGSQDGAVAVLMSSSASWTNLAESALNTGRYTAGDINNLGFYSSGSSLLGFWTVQSGASSNTVYQVNGTSPSQGEYIGNAFYNISTNGQQTGNSTSFITVVNAPTTITSTTTDTNGNLWAGSTNGQVYVLRQGAGGQWTNTQISGVTGNTYVWPTGSTGASVTNSTNSTVYSAQ